VATVLAVDKDTLQLELLTFLLKHEGHRVHATTDGEMALEYLQSRLVDLAIVETALQRQDGFRICQQMRKLSPHMPLMILSERREEEQICRDLRGAADDYVVKPFSPHQLLARVHALLRRTKLGRNGGVVDENMSIGEIALNLHQMHAVVNGHAVLLTHREFSLLQVLMSNANRVLSREQLMRLAWGGHFAATGKAVDVYILRLRQKIQPHVQNGPYIRALRGFGYKFEMPRPPAPVGAPASLRMVTDS
jgi:two-component system, OmpR family, alkaline phosphatase synthesis response regulator PhoP